MAASRRFPSVPIKVGLSDFLVLNDTPNTLQLDYVAEYFRYLGENIRDMGQLWDSFVP